MRILLEMFKWLVDKVNSIGQPKKSNTVQSTEVISAVKVKNNRNPTSSAASTNFIQTKIKNEIKPKTPNPYGKSGTDGAIGNIGVGGVSGNLGTSSRGYYPQYAIDRFEQIVTNFDERMGGFDQDVLDKIDSDLEQLLSGGNNIRPRDITKMYKSKNSKK
jgi:hypothetical protein